MHAAASMLADNLRPAALVTPGGWKRERSEAGCFIRRGASFRFMACGFCEPTLPP